MIPLLVLYLCVAVLGHNVIPRGGKVINGQDATEGQFPWQILVISYILLEDDVLGIFCSGAIISTEWVLTSAHCINGAYYIGLYYGNVLMMDDDEVFVDSLEYIVHEGFVNTTLHDIGLVHLRTPVIFDERTQPIALAEEELLPETEVIVSGWGHSDHSDWGNYTTNLQYAVATIISNEDCVKLYGDDVVSKDIVCAIGSNPVQGPCFGDGGAPLVAGWDTNNPVHVGIFSFINGVDCDENYPAGYTRTANYRNWIQEHTGV